MNKFKGHIKEINAQGNLSIVTVTLNEESAIKAIIIDTPESAEYLQLGKEVEVLFKETEVIVSTSTELNISLQNKLQGTVHTLEKGTLLSRLEIESPAGIITSIISTEAVEQLEITKGSNVLAMVKLNEVILSA